MINKIRIPGLVLLALIFNGCATSPSGDSFDSPIGEWSETFEDEGRMQTSSFRIVDDKNGAYTNPASKVVFTDTSDKLLWKGYWVMTSGSQACPESKNDSRHWGEMIYQFNESYNRYTGSWDYCGKGTKFSIEGIR